MDSSDIIVFTPAGICDEALAIAACRAGARGILDLEFIIDLSHATNAIARLQHFTSNSFGVKITAEHPMLEHLEKISDQLAWIVLAGGAHPDLQQIVTRLCKQGRTVIFEAISFDEVLVAEKCGVQGLILKGNEAAGRVGVESTFILLQRWAAHATETCSTLAVWAQGGIGLHTSAACIVAGATGVVLDSQLILTRESKLCESSRQALSAFDGSETQLFGERLGQTYRLFNRPGLSALDELAREEERLLASKQKNRTVAWRNAIFKSVTTHCLVLTGQDACHAKSLAQRYVTVGGIIEALVLHVNSALHAASRQQLLSCESAFAKQHKTRYPVVQGPMTRVSDTAHFAKAVNDAGGLPILALSFLRRQEAEKLLQETAYLMAQAKSPSWAVGILGFLPPEIRREQIEAILTHRPPFALIAGGRPDQAQELEQQGIATYLHVPSPGLLKRFLQAGCRRFVFEGRECGGHVGPRSSFVLWDSMCDVILEHYGQSERIDDLQLIFAGGIHNAVSGAMCAAMTAPLVERGASIGLLMGTAYLFTKEAVESGAIVPRFQEEVLNCNETVLLQTGPGHAIRCIKTPYCETFDEEKRRLQKEGQPAEEITRALEWMNIGRLRIASKGLDRLALLTTDEQHDRGMYMIGQLAALRDKVITMNELHEDVCNGGCRLLKTVIKARPVVNVPQESPSDIAIIGMACFYPGAKDLRTYWSNIIKRFNAVTEIPASHWDWRLYYDSNPRAHDKIISKWGGFLDDIYFDPVTYGITPNSLYSIEPLQLFLLEAVRFALADAGYADRPFNRERTAAILGIGGAGNPLAVAYGLRTCMPLLNTVPDLAMTAEEILKKAENMLPKWTEDSFPGILLNVAVGRVANRFNFGGANYAIDAACGSSLAALYACVRELETKTCDVAVVMGADTVQTPYSYMAFSKTHALSPRGKCMPFDAAADGIVLSEGIGACILKRLSDAERDGDQIYAVIKGVGASSDGKEKGLTAPNASGQLRALQRAYSKANISPARVGLIEAHGTGTVVGDQTEVNSMMQVLEQAGARTQSCALGSVKSMIGHSKCAAGIAGLIKTTLALHHKLLPPTLLERPNPKANFEKSALFLNTEARPWIQGKKHSRCAGVSAFGFGGTNFHAVLEEYRNEYLKHETSALSEFPAELVLFRGSRDNLIQQLENCQIVPNLAELAAKQWASLGASAPTVAIVAHSFDDLKEKIQVALTVLRSSKQEYSDVRGIYIAENPKLNGKVAFLFPGQGSQYPNMLGQVAMAFPEVREAFDCAEEILDGQFEKPLGKYIFPPSFFTADEEEQAKDQLCRTDIAQPSLAAASMGMFSLLKSFGIKPDYLAGHSFGEYVALAAADALDEDELIRLAHQRGQLMHKMAHAGSMIAVEASVEMVSELLIGIEGVVVANDNAPSQTVIAGTTEALQMAQERLKEKGLRSQRLQVSAGFHSSLVAPATKPLKDVLEMFCFRKANLPVFSNTTAALYPDDPTQYGAHLAEHLASRVRFREEILALYDAGVHTFIEVGPQSILTALVGSTLANRPHLAVASDQKGRPGLTQLQHLLAQSIVNGLPVSLDRLYNSRNLDRVEHSLAPTTWVVNSVRSRPLDAPEPLLIGQTRQNRPNKPQESKAVNESDQMMLRFQDLMSRFLEMQKSVMSTYLAGGDVTAASLVDPVKLDSPTVQSEIANPYVASQIQSNVTEFNKESLTAELVALVSKRTGYPKEMLGLDLNLEADLGVDSIKRIEILGDMAESLGALDSTNSHAIEMEKLTTIMTMRGIIEYLITKLQHQKPQEEISTQSKALAIAPMEIERGLVALVDAPASTTHSLLLPRGCILITDDGRGVAEELMDRMADFGQKSILVRMSDADLTDPVAVQALVERIKDQAGAIAGLIHLLPLAQHDVSRSWKERMDRDVKSLYLLARACESDIRQSVTTGGALLVAATGMGGALGFESLSKSYFAGHGGVAGFVKCLGFEWQDVLVRVVDLDPSKEVRDIASRLLAELSIVESPLEVGYSGLRRVTWEPKSAPLEKKETTELLLHRTSTVLITGGARGITAAVAEELGRRFQPNLVIIGRSRLPDEKEDEETRALTQPADIKAALIARIQTEGRAVVHAEVQAAYQRLLHDREIRQNLAKLTQTGAKVHYYQVDVRQPEFAKTLDEIEHRFGGIDGVIHGAGVIEDRLLRDKTPDSFDRVFGTKVDSAFTLAEKLRPERLKFCVFFASIASRYGNKGQADYAAANEVLSKLARYLDHTWPCRVFSVAWGPWSGIGMVADLEKHLTQRGLKLISPEVGSRLLVDELIYGKKGESEVVIAGGAEHMIRPAQHSALAGVHP